MSVTMKTNQEFTFSVAFLNDKGKPAKVDGVPTWATDNSDLLILSPAADGMSCKVASGDMASPVNGIAPKVQVTADADLGAGVSAIIGTSDVIVEARPATTVTLTADAPVDTP